MLWEKSSALKSNSKNQIKKLFYFCWSFCPPGSGSRDPVGSGSRDPVGSGSRDPIDSGSSPDLQNWTQRYRVPMAMASNCYQTVFRIRHVLVWIRFWDPDPYHPSLFSSCFQDDKILVVFKVFLFLRYCMYI
jgi:hypothetical protein